MGEYPKNSIIAIQPVNNLCQRISETPCLRPLSPDQSQDPTSLFYE
jgi:hypothetical protein